MSSPRTSGNRTSQDRVSRTACIRCRQRKKRCDQQLPKCRLCELAGVECLGYDSVSKRQVPRSYVNSLEERVAYLEGQLQSYRARDEVSEALQSVSPASTTHVSDPGYVRIFTAESSTALDQDVSPVIVANVTAAGVSSLGRPTSGQEPAFCKIALTEIMGADMTPKTPLHRDNIREKENGNASDILGDLEPNPLSLPSRQTAQNLVNAYFQYTSTSMPLLHKPTFQRKLHFLYEMPRAVSLTESHTTTDARIAVFFTFEIFAVALLVLQKHDPSRVPTWVADRYHKTALIALNEANVPNNLEGVQALLLIAQYSHYHPTAWSSWRIVGQALRLAVELGLHQEPSKKLDCLTRDIMKRTFWVAYAMDRNFSTTMSLPSCLPDGAILTDFPSDVDDDYISADEQTALDAPVSPTKRISLHFYRYRQIQSEMQTVLFQAPSPPFQPVDVEVWQQEMQERIQTWYRDSPLGDDLNTGAKGVVETFEVNYQNAIFYLFRPSPTIPCPSDTQLVAMTHAASAVIQLYRRFFREQKLTIYWQAVENVYSAGTSLMYAYVHSSQVRNLLAFRSLESLVHTCSSTLWGMVERIPAFKGKRDAFDLAASKIVPDIGANFVATGIISTPSWTAYDSSFGQPDAANLSGDSLIGETSGRLASLGTLPSTGLSSAFSGQQPGFSPSNAFLGGELEGRNHGESLSFPDFDDLSLVWEGAPDINGNFNPVWI